MKKIFVLTIFLVGTFAIVCSAVGKNDFSLGGVYPDMPYDNVIAMYGQPTSRLRGYSQLIHNIIIYGDSVEIAFMNGKVRHVVTTANNGWRTPSGLCVGMSIDEVIIRGVRPFSYGDISRKNSLTEVKSFCKLCVEVGQG